VVRERHPFEGELLDVMGRTHRKGVLVLTLVLPDGTRSLIPAAWTDLGADTAEVEMLAVPSSSAGTVGSVRDLLHARQVVDALLGRLGGAGSGGIDAEHQELSLIHISEPTRPY